MDDGKRILTAITKRCPKCGEPSEKQIIMRPAIGSEGTDVVLTVGVACKCVMQERQATEERFRSEETMRRVKELRRLSLMDVRLKDVSFASFRETQDNGRVYGIARKYVRNFDEMYRRGQGILFYGDVGTGKSYTAAAIANELLAKAVPVIMTSFVKVLEEMRNMNNDGSAEKFIARMNEAKLLIIDDLGAERGTDFALERVYDVIDSRYRSGKPMILTTNLDIGYMRGMTDIRYSRIYDRIFEMCYPVKCVGQSWRKQAAVRRFDEMKKLMEE